MNISKDLIEKYHRNQCSTEERDAVEEWLFSSHTDEGLQLPLGESKAVHKADIWKGIADILPEEAPAETKTKPLAEKPIRKYSFWIATVAATIVVGMSGLGVVQLQRNKQQTDPELVSINNTSTVKVHHLEVKGYALSVGTSTSAKIDNLTGVVDLSGSILISPKKDITLQFEGSPEKITFKKGQTYIILKSKEGTNQIIVSEKNLMDLPPILQKQIINEFNI
ncbi:hypothetical protein AQ505_13025 [Pedobacter sp. PACM 27299]|uniref:hypothetical protein n=1 Tax=Pedobacter sp. PACM 27299 TaxID=1727164 RepID=UPI000705B3C5|nr:hypothetical protein [Pedobacter sp. PACM 27299]ALL06340.1 hypothetical protein AQ505_13025 [Pedobacter sp. PACM 27299]